MKESKKDKVLKIIRRDGYIDNYDVVKGKHGFISLRLSDIIFRLRNEGLIEIDDEKSCFVPKDSKNWRYVLKSKPKSVEEYIVKGGNDDGTDKIIRKVIW